MIVMTNLILLIGAGLFSRSIWEFEANAFAQIVGSDVDDTGGDGPGSFDVRNSVVRSRSPFLIPSCPSCPLPCLYPFNPAPLPLPSPPLFCDELE